MAEVDGQFWHGDMQELWIACGSHPIREAEYRYLLARRKHAQDHEPESPFAAPRKRVDMNTAPPPSFGRK